MGPLRVWNGRFAKPVPGLTMTRSLGDFTAKEVGVIAVPDVIKKQIDSTVKFMILASDGLWEVMSSREAAGVVGEYMARKDPAQASAALMSAALVKWREVSLSDFSVLY